jgi:histone H3/H4
MLGGIRDLPVELRIDRVQRLLRKIEQDAPLLAIRVRQLSKERQESVESFADHLAAATRAELCHLLEEKAAADSREPGPQGAD